MPCRIVDGDAWARSRKIKNSVEEKYRLHYLAWLTLAEANGTFECDLERIHADLYAFQLPGIKIRHVQQMFEQFKAAGVLATWEERGKTWGFFIGSEKPGRLVSKEHLKRYKDLPPAYPGLGRDESGDMPKGSGVGLEKEGFGGGSGGENQRQNQNPPSENQKQTPAEKFFANMGEKERAEYIMKSGRFTEQCLDIWKEIYGESAFLNRPEKSKHTDKKDWAFLVDNTDQELLLKAFRLYAEEHDGSDVWALCRFERKAAEYMQRVQPLKNPGAPVEDEKVTAVRTEAAKKDAQVLVAMYTNIQKTDQLAEPGENPDDYFSE